METTKVSARVHSISRYIQPAKIVEGVYHPKVTYFRVFFEENIPTIKKGEILLTKVVYFQTMAMLSDIANVTEGINFGVADIMNILPGATVALSVEPVDIPNKGIYSDIHVEGLKLDVNKRDDVEFVLQAPFMTHQQRLDASAKLAAKKANRLFGNPDEDAKAEAIAKAKAVVEAAEAAVEADPTPANKGKLTKARKALAAAQA